MKFTFPPESRVLDGYTIKRAIHRGGFGEVYYALSDAGREVALKLLQNNSDVELRGVQQCLNLSHPNLVTIFDVRKDADGDHWIIMEYVGGETLDAAIRRHPQGMPMELVRKWLPGIAHGVAYLHSRGLVHRDLKPANIFSDAGVVKVGDVGLSKFITPSRRSAHTQSVGTVYYMSPEVAKGRYGKEVDVYALGVILFEMLTGHVPFDGESTAEILMKHLSEPPDLRPLPPRLQPVIARSLEKDPAKRFESIEAFAKAFDDAVLGKSPVEARPAVGAAPPTTIIDTATMTAVPGPNCEHAATDPGTLFMRGVARIALLSLYAGCYLVAMKGIFESNTPTQLLAASAFTLVWGAIGALAWTRWKRESASREASQSTADRRGVKPLAAAGENTPSFSDAVTSPPSPNWHALQPTFRGWLWVLGGGLLFAVGTRTSGWEAFGYFLMGLGVGYVSYTTPRVFARREWPFDAPDGAVDGPTSTRQPPPPAAGFRPLALTPFAWRTRMAHWVTSAALSTGIGGGLLAGTAAIAPSLFSLQPGQGVAPELVGYFGATTLVAVWFLTFAVKLTQGFLARTPADRREGVRRLALVVAGLAAGAAAWGIGRYLQLDLSQVFAGQSMDGVFESLGERPLVGDVNGRPAPTLLGFLVFFGSLFGLRSWWRQIDLYRESRFRAASILMSVLVAWLCTALFAFPQTWGLLWAAVISATVQLASPWSQSFQSPPRRNGR